MAKEIVGGEGGVAIIAAHEIRIGGKIVVAVLSGGHL